MSSFSTKERLIASLLSSAPGIKRFIKSIYIRFNALIYHKKYTYRIYHNAIAEIVRPFNTLNKETFFGYYDKCPDNGTGKILAHSTNYSTTKKPSEKIAVSVAVFDLNTTHIHEIAQSNSYNWQQGTRCQWLDEDSFIFNDFQQGRYKSFVYSVSANGIVKSFDYPVQESFGKEWFLSINYCRIMRLRPDYGYRNLPTLTDAEMDNLTDDGIWIVNYETGKASMLHSLETITAYAPKDIFTICRHKVNHLMVAPDGRHFIFIHRFFKKGQRFDRLLLSDFKQLTVLADENMVSHCCWIDNKTVLGYLLYGGENGFYYINIETGEVRPCAAMNSASHEDGHPSCFGDWIVFDTYPDRSRMLHLYLYNRKTEKVIQLLEVHQSVKYAGESRCDLHPRFSKDGQKIFFDTVYSGKRTLAYIDIHKIL